MIKSKSLKSNNDVDLFNFIQEAAVIGTWEYDVTTQDLFWSDVTRKIHEVDSDYVPNVESAISFYKEGISKSKITRHFTSAIEYNNNYDIEVEIITPKGKEKWVRAIGYPVLENNKCIRVRGLFQDISKAKRTETEIKKLLRTTVDQNKRLINFAHIVSHNLRTHSGNLSLLLNLIEEEHPKTTENELFPLLKKASENLNETILNLNEVAQINIALTETYFKVNVHQEIQKHINSISAKAIDAHATINNDVPEDVFLNTIPAYFESIVINLLSNAIKYRRVNVPLTINIFCEQNDDYFILKFEDNGCGIDLDLHGDRIFGMYKTFHKNKDARGLGLFLIKNQIEAMQGKIKVDSFVNKGSTFTIFLRK